MIEDKILFEINEVREHALTKNKETHQILETTFGG
jgi:hypothetical protein